MSPNREPPNGTAGTLSDGDAVLIETDSGESNSARSSAWQYHLQTTLVDV
jgi:hypothetical protein